MTPGITFWVDLFLFIGVMTPGITFWVNLFQNVAPFGLVIVTTNFNVTIFWGVAPWSMEDVQKFIEDPVATFINSIMFM
jgi:hypothetical protein